MHIIPPNFNKKEFFEEISNRLSKDLKNYDSIVIAGDLNIDLVDPHKDNSNHLSDLLVVFNLKYLVKERVFFWLVKGP